MFACEHAKLRVGMSIVSMNLEQIHFRTHDQCEALTESILSLPAQTRRERRLALSAKQLLWKAADTASYVYRLESGRVEVTEADQDGRVTAAHIIEPGQTFGALCFCDHRNEPSGMEARCLTQSIVLRTGYEDFKHAVKTDKEAASRLVEALCARVATAELRNRVLVIHDARKRLATLLHQLAMTKQAELGKELNAVHLHVSHAYLATHASLTRPHTTVLMTRLRALGYIDYQRGSAIEVKLQKLRLIFESTGESQHSKGM